MIAKLFSPTITYRLFDPMPLPRIIRARRSLRSKKAKGLTKTVSSFIRVVKKVPLAC